MKPTKLLRGFICSYLLVLSSSFAFGQSWDWGAPGYSTGLKPQTYCTSVASDISGNVYITGYYSGGILFGSDSIFSNGNFNAYLAKYDLNGTLLWATQPTDDSIYSTCMGYSAATDESGNIIITGVFAGTIQFGNYKLTNGNNPYTFFVAKYDPNGNVLWAKTGPVSYYYMDAQESSITTDKYNNIYVSGVFYDTTWVGNYMLTTQGQTSPFLVKYDANGNVLWAETPGSPSNKSSSYMTSVTTDSKGNVYLAGNFIGNFSFGSYNLTSLTVSSAFVVKYSGIGNVVWAKQSDNETLLTSSASAASVITDTYNDVYITGSFEDSVKFGSYTLYSPLSNYGYGSAFLTKYDTNGNVVWAKQSSYGLIGSSLATDQAGSVYLGTTNNLSDSTFSFDNFTLHVVSWADNSAFLWKFDNEGTAICGSALENAGYENSVGVCCSSSSSLEYIYMAGTFINGDTVTCGPDVLFTNYSGFSSIYVTRWLNCAADAGINDMKDENGIVEVYPNPSSGIFTLRFLGDVSTSLNIRNTVEVYNMLGEKVYSQFIVHSSSFIVNLNNQPNGIYLYRLISGQGNLIGEGKLVIEK